MLPLVLAMAVLVAACGYRQEVPGLPGGATRLAIAPVQNATYESELDIRLRARLDKRLRSHAHLRLVDRPRAELVLEVGLQELTIMRTIETIAPRRKVLTFTLTGRVSLMDRRSDDYVLSDSPVTATEQVAVAEAALETPAIRYDGIDKVVAAFAEEVEAMLLRHF